MGHAAPSHHNRGRQGSGPAGSLRFFHTPVMVPQVLEFLGVRPGGRYIDATVGEGGHAQAILARSAPNGRLLGLDADPEALARARLRLAPFGPRAVLAHARFEEMEGVARGLGFAPADGVLMDLGLSSLQLEGEERGFSFRREAPLDMRFDPRQGTTAADLVNRLPEGELARIIREFGEEPRARAIARAIVRSRPLHTTTQLAGVVARVVGPRRRLHPATRVFQALRIAVNRELEALETALTQATNLLAPGGRLVVISYHSLEDRVVKRFLRWAEAPCTCPQGVAQCRCGRKPLMRQLTRKPATPGQEEVRENPRCRSARLRAAVRVAEGA